MKGASAAVLLSPAPTSGDPYRRGEEIAVALAQAVQESRIPKVVALSSIGAHHETGTGIIAMLNSLEKHLPVAPSTTFLRPGYFEETWEEVIRPVIDDGVLPSFLEPTLKIPMVSTIDVGRTSARLMSDNSTGTRVLELDGPEDWCANDVAAAFSSVLGRPVKTAFVPSEDRFAALAQQGIPQEVAEALLGMYKGLANGRVARESGTEQLRGTIGLTDAISRLVRKETVSHGFAIR